MLVEIREREGERNKNKKRNKQKRNSKKKSQLKKARFCWCVGYMPPD
jgi:hypothetical protein